MILRRRRAKKKKSATKAQKLLDDAGLWTSSLSDIVVKSNSANEDPTAAQVNGNFAINCCHAS